MSLDLKRKVNMTSSAIQPIIEHLTHSVLFGIQPGFSLSFQMISGGMHAFVDSASSSNANTTFPLPQKAGLGKFPRQDR
jgi:hypothetical protein